MGDLPSKNLAIAWLLRFIYMRMAALPQAAWIASCTLMRLIEIADLYLSIAPDNRVGDPNRVNVQRLIVCNAQYLNVWISYNFGLSEVSFKIYTSSLTLLKPGEYTGELLATANAEP